MEIGIRDYYCVIHMPHLCVAPYTNRAAGYSKDNEECSEHAHEVLLERAEYKYKHKKMKKRKKMANVHTKGQSLVWTDDEVELLLRVTLNYKTTKHQENIDWESCQSKYKDISLAFQQQYPTGDLAAGKDFPHDAMAITRPQVTTKLKGVRYKYRHAVEFGRRQGHGRVILLFFDLCQEIWGGSPPNTTPAPSPSGIETSHIKQEDESSSSTWNSSEFSPAGKLSPDSRASVDNDGLQTTHDNPRITHDRVPPAGVRHGRDLPPAKFKCHRGNRLKRKAPADAAVEEDLQIKRRMLEFMENSERRSSESLQSMMLNITSITSTIQDGFSLLRSLMLQQQSHMPAYTTHPNGSSSSRLNMALTQVSSNKCAGGFQKVFEHESSELKCKMKFAIYLPPKAETEKCPVMYWLSGLTCTEQNFITKAGSQLAAAEHGIIIVAPDTSPRGCNIEGEDESWDFGTGAGFYVDATEDPWKTNYRMYSYITEELPKLINANFPTNPDRMSVSGHSMGGHGALICALKNPGKYKAVSAFAPICNPIQCPWGQKAFSGYLGSDRTTWEAYDATVLAASYSGPQLDILIDQGRDDQFLSASQLLPDNLIAVCSEKKIPVVFRLQPGYDHSYFFIYSFMNDHIKHHAKFLNA